MMDSIANFKEEVSKRLECLICMDRLRNPKDLHCHHTFCKECLEGVLKFRKDGSAIIKCPLRCNGQTVIPKDKTTKDLASPFNLKGILEMFEENVKKTDPCKKRPACSAAENCPNKIDTYCSTCNKIMCHICRLKHDGDTEDQHTFIPIIYHEKEGQLKIFCTEHSTVAKYVCCEGKYICVFCRFREHHGHTHHTIELQAKRTKELLTHHEKKIDKMRRMLQKSLIAAETSIAHCKEILTKSLKARKLLCLANYLKFLNKKEDQIQRDFDTVTAKHIRKYKMAEPIEYFRKAINFDNANLILERELILLSIAQCNSGNVGIPLLSLYLTDANYYDKNSLGVLKCDVKDNVSLLDSDTKASVHYDVSSPDLSKIDFSMMDELKRLLDEAIERKHEFSHKPKIGRQNSKRRHSSNANIIPEPPQSSESSVSQEKYSPLQNGVTVHVLSPRQRSLPSPKICENQDITATNLDERNLTKNSIMERQNISRGNVMMAEPMESPTATITKEEKRIQKKVSKEVLKNLKKQGINYVYDLIRENDEETFELLVTTKADVGKMRGSFGSTPLLTAGRFNRVEILKKLLEHGSTVDDKGSSGSNVLHISAFHDSFEALLWLLPRCQHLVDEKNSGDNRTPLHYAASNGYLRCMKALLSCGANINLKDKDDCTPLDKAKELNKQACVEELQNELAQRGEVDTGKYSDCHTAEECRTKYNFHVE